MIIALVHILQIKECVNLKVNKDLKEDILSAWNDREFNSTKQVMIHLRFIYTTKKYTGYLPNLRTVERMIKQLHEEEILITVKGTNKQKPEYELNKEKIQSICTDKG